MLNNHNNILTIVVLALAFAVFSFATPAVSTAASNIAAKIAVSTAAEILTLVDAGFMPEDAEVTVVSRFGVEARRVAWLEENGYVTVIVPEEALAGLRDRFPVLEELPLAENPADGADALDEAVEYELSWGWPNQLAGEPAINHQVPTIADMDDNGDLEILLHTIAGYRYAWQHSGAMVPGYPLDPFTPDAREVWVTGNTWETGAAGNLGGNGGEEVVYGAGSGILFRLGYAMDPLDDSMWLDFGEGLFFGVPAAVDMNDDGLDEIIINVYDAFSPAPREGFIHVLDGDGYDLPGWPVLYPNPSSSSPVAGDIDGDGEAEIVIATGNTLDSPGRIYAWEADGEPVNGWPVGDFHTIGGTPTLADLDGDGGLEVIIRCQALGDDGVNGIYAFHGDGTAVTGFPFVTPAGHPFGSVAVADMDGNGLLDFAIGTVEAVDGAGVYVYEQDSGLRDGFPRRPGGSWIGGSPVFADMDGDGLPEVIVSRRNSGASSAAQIVAYNSVGEKIGYAEAQVPEEQFPASPTAFDLDGDGLIELIAASSSGRLYVWDTEGIPGESMFPCEKGNFSRNGIYTPGIYNLLEVNSERTNRHPTGFSLASVYPIPFNSTVQLEVTVPVQGMLTVRIFDLLGREVALLARGEVTAGPRRFTWKADGSLPSGVFFARAEYDGAVRVKKLLLIR